MPQLIFFFKVTHFVPYLYKVNLEIKMEEKSILWKNDCPSEDRDVIELLKYKGIYLEKLIMGGKPKFSKTLEIGENEEIINLLLSKKKREERKHIIYCNSY